MIPQSSFMVVAPIATGREAELRELLSAMNLGPGRVDPANPLVPFGRFETLHFARFVILDDATSGDVAAYGLPVPSYPAYLAFLGDFDGAYDEFLRELVATAGDGLRRVFAHCEGFVPGSDLSSWMRANEHPPATYYVNWRGRTVRQCRAEARLRAALVREIQDHPEHLKLPAAQLWQVLRKFAAAGGLMPPPEPPTPVGWRIRNALHAAFAAPAIAAALAVWGVALLFGLRSHEKSDPEICPPPANEHAAKLAAIEDHGFTNQFSAMGSLKPGLFRRITLRLLLWTIDYTTRHIYVRGRLARVHTIHFARWVYLDGGARLFFASNYDGSLESYMDDFINKVAFGLNAVFGNGIGYPRTRWLLLDGAKDEQKFKYFLRRHQLPTDVWYNAHEGFGAFDLQRNSVIRQALERPAISEQEARQWVALL